MTTTALRALAVQVDERLADLYDAQWSQQQDAMLAADSTRRYAGQEREVLSVNRWGTKEYGNWIGTIAEALATIDAMEEPVYAYSKVAAAKKAAADYRFAIAGLDAIATETAELNAVWIEEGRWTRAFLVLNANGHVHNGMDCSTCFDSTRYEWLTAYSAADEAEIVGDAGETACTVCYPSAPAEILNRPANLQSKTRAEKEAAKAQRAAEKAARDAKRLAKAATRTGEDLRIPDDWDPARTERISTEYSARRVWNEAQRDIAAGTPDTTYATDPEGYLARIAAKKERQRERQTLIETALADKYGIDPAEMRTQLLAKYAKRR